MIRKQSKWEGVLDMARLGVVLVLEIPGTTMRNSRALGETDIIAGTEDDETAVGVQVGTGDGIARVTETEKGSGDTTDIAMTVTGITEVTDGSRNLGRERGNIGDGGRARAQGAGIGEGTTIATDDIGTRTVAIVHIHVKEIQTILAGVELTS